MERAGLQVAGLAMVVAVAASVLGAGPVALSAVLVGLLALWPVLRAH